MAFAASAVNQSLPPAKTQPVRAAQRAEVDGSSGLSGHEIRFGDGVVSASAVIRNVCGAAIRKTRSLREDPGPEGMRATTLRVEGSTMASV